MPSDTDRQSRLDGGTMSDLTPGVQDAVERLAYRPREAAAALGLSRARVYELMAEGRIDYRQIGSVRLIPRTALDALLSDSDGGVTPAG
jgi:excisionase family DNA binding protein